MKSLAALLLAIFVLSGCGGGMEKQIVGSWKVDTAKSEFKGDQMKDDASKKMAMALLETISLDIKEDKTFAMSVVFPINGTWTLTGNKLVLTPIKKEGETMSFGGKDVMDFTVDAGGTSMSSEMAETGMSGKLVMVKAPAAK